MKVNINTLKKGDSFIYNGIKYKLTDSEKCFKALSECGEKEISGISAFNSNIEVEIL